MPQLPHMMPGVAAIHLMLSVHSGRHRAIDVSPGSSLLALCQALTAAHNARQEEASRDAEREMRRIALQAAWDARNEQDEDLALDDEPDDRCTNPGGHEWSYTGTAYGGDDDRWHGEGRCLCIHCGADGDA